MPWTEILGQAPAVQQLQQAVSREKVSHAYIFHGPRGVGKRTTARVLAQALACGEAPDDGGCGVCRTCRNIESGAYPDLMVVSSEGSLRLEQTQQLIRQAFISPLEGRRKMFIVVEAERLTPEAGNSLLKVLEEPPGDATFVLTTTTLAGVLATIKSRCLPIGFNPLSDLQVLELVRERGWAAAEQESLVVNMAAGSPGAASAVTQSGGLLALREECMEIIRRLSEPNDAARDRIKSGELTRVQLEVRLRILGSLFRDFLIWQKTGEDKRLINRDQVDFIRSQAGKWPDLVRGMEIIENTSRRLAQNANLPLLWEVCCLELSELRGGSHADRSWSAI